MPQSRAHDEHTQLGIRVERYQLATGNPLPLFYKHTWTPDFRKPTVPGDDPIRTRLQQLSHSAVHYPNNFGCDLPVKISATIFTPIPRLFSSRRG